MNNLRPTNETLDQPLPFTRSFFAIGMTVLAFVLTAIAVLPLFAMILSIVSQGLPKFSWEVFTSLPAAIGEENQPNGFANVIPLEP